MTDSESGKAGLIEVRDILHCAVALVETLGRTILDFHLKFSGVYERW